MTAFPLELVALPVEVTAQWLRLPDGSTLLAELQPRTRWALFGHEPGGAVHLVAMTDTEQEAASVAERVQAGLILAGAEAAGTA